MTTSQKALPWLFVALAIVYVASSAVRTGSAPGAFDLDALGRVPVSGSGRVKPLDTVARNSLMILSGRQTLVAGRERRPAIEWYADLVARPRVAIDEDVFRIDHPDVVALLGLDGSGRTRFSFAELLVRQDEILRQASLAGQTQAKKRDPFQRAILSVYNRMDMYAGLQRLERPYLTPPLSPGTEWRPMFGTVPAEPDETDSRWLLDAFTAYGQGDAEAFNTAVAEHLRAVDAVLPGQTRRARYEVMLNRAQPFYVASVLYVLTFLLGCVGLLLSQLSRMGWTRSLGSTVLGVLAVAFVVHTLAIVARIYLQGRPPVTNLYSSAVFIGWTSVLLGMIIEKRTRMGLGGITASAIGFATLVIAHHLGGGGDTMEMMQAVLDTNFWLATHVVVITIGYAGTFFAGALGIAYILLGVLTRSLDRERRAALGGMIYGVVCFAALMSFTGTVLGGIWADQSWGRFWGWDPKENGAALIVLANLLILHARWGGLIQGRGVAVLVVWGNIITAWSWFGTNMLGVGLHSYGFTDSAVFWLMLFVLSQLLIMGIGLTPMRLWRSVRAGPPRAKTGPSAEDAGRTE